MTEGPGRARRSRLRLRASVAVVALGAGAYWGAQWVEHRAGHVFETDARIASDMVSISSRVAGWVVELNVEQGDRIRTGSVLVHVDARDARHKLEELKARIDEIEAEQKMTEAEISMIRSQTRHRIDAQRHRVNAGRSAVKAAKTRVDLLSSEHRRTRSLAGRKIVPQQRLETAEAALRDSRDRQSQAIAELAAREAQLSEAKAALKQVSVLNRQIDRLRAEARRVAAQVEQQRLEVDDRTIVSPINGLVDQTFVDAGEYVRAGQRLVLIHDPANVWVNANVRETDLRHIEVGAPVEVMVDAYPGRSIPGKVVRIGNAATSQFALLRSPNPSGNFTKISQRIPVKIAIERDGLSLAPGMMVEIEIVIPSRRDDR